LRTYQQVQYYYGLTRRRVYCHFHQMQAAAHRMTTWGRRPPTYDSTGIRKSRLFLWDLATV